MPSCVYATLASGKAITLCSNIHKKAKRANLLDDAGQPLTHTERPYRNLSDIHMAVASDHNTLLWQLWFSTRSLFFTTACSFKRPWQKQHVEICGESEVGYLDQRNLERNNIQTMGQNQVVQIFGLGIFYYECLGGLDMSGLWTHLSHQKSCGDLCFTPTAIPMDRPRAMASSTSSNRLARREPRRPKVDLATEGFLWRDNGCV